MTPHKTIAGYNLDEVFEQEEARLKAERDAAEAAQRRQELERKRVGRKSLPATTTPPVIVPMGSSVAIYKNIEFEHPAYRQSGKTDKTLLTYDASLARLRAAGFERHARPQEMFGLLADGLEGKLTVEEKLIYDDQLTSYGEWLSLAFERRGDCLITYVDPEGLEWRNDKYVKTESFKFAEKKDFDISGKVSQQYIDLDQFHDDIVQFLYGRSFASLPRERLLTARLYLPPDQRAWPVCRVAFDYWCAIVGDYFNNGASRGVRGRASMPKK